MGWSNEYSELKTSWKKGKQGKNEVEWKSERDDIKLISF